MVHRGRSTAWEVSVDPYFKKQEPLNRIYFPETWIWHCFTLRSHKEVFNLQTPHSVTRWRAQAIGMSPTKGVGISQIQKFNTEKSVFVDFIFPAKTIRFEVRFEINSDSSLHKRASSRCPSSTDACQDVFG